MLTVLELDNARALLLAQLESALADQRYPHRSVSVPIALATGRVLAKSIAANQDVPAFDRSQVDGIAVVAADTFGASESLPAMLNWLGDVAMGQAAQQALDAGSCVSVPTGGMIPAGADAMVMIEQVETLSSHIRLVEHSVTPGSHITKRGEDVRAGTLLFEAGHQLRPQDIGAIAAIGQSTVEVLPAVRVGILSTGDELVHPSDNREPLLTGQVYDINGPMLAAMIRQTDCEPVEYGIIRDDLIPLSHSLASALVETDLVLISGGSSVGTRDFVEQAIQQAGPPGVLWHGLAVKPGKPTLAGRCGNKLVIGLPGHPVAAWFMMNQLVRPLLARLTGRVLPEPVTLAARTTARIPSNHGREEFVPVRLRWTPDGWDAQPLPLRSGLITLLTAADGYLRIPRDSEGLPEQAVVTICLLRDLPDGRAMSAVNTSQNQPLKDR